MISNLTGSRNSSTLNISHNYANTPLRLILFAFSLIWVIGFFYPVLITQNNSLVKYFLSRIYSSVCHQESSKCLIISSESILVCARCTGIYLGALTAGLLALIYSFPQIRINMIVLTFILMIFDVSFTTVGIYHYSEVLALVTGLFFGAVIYLFMLNELENFFTTKSIKRNE